MAFHRHVQPTYYGAPALPAGPSSISFNGTLYNFFNVVSGGVGASGGSAYMDGAKAAGPNAGTYAVAFGEDATSINANRGMRALIENTDFLDDLFNRDIAIPVRTNNASSGGGISAIVLPASTFVGNNGIYPLDMLFSILDSNDREITTTSGAKVAVTAISGATVGAGFSSGTVTLNLAPAIPASTSYRVYYSTRSKLAALPVDALTFIKIRGAEEISAVVENIFRIIQGPSAQNIPWDATPTTTLYDAALGGLDARYRRATAREATQPTDWPAAIAANTAGSGGWYKKDGPGFTGFNFNGGLNRTGFQGGMEWLLGATWGVQHESSYSITNGSFNSRYATGSGFVHLSGRPTGAGDPCTFGSIFSFLDGARYSISPSGTAHTRVYIGTGVTLNGGIFSLDSGVLYSSGRSAVVVGHTIFRIKLTVSGEIHNLVFNSITGPAGGTVLFLDGAFPGYASGTTATIIDWINPVFYVSGDANSARGIAAPGTAAIGHNLRGLTYVDVPAVDGGSMEGALPPQPARFFARTVTSNAAEFGYVSSDTFGGSLRKRAYITGDGAIVTPSMILASQSIQTLTDIFVGNDLTVTNNATITGNATAGTANANTFRSKSIVYSIVANNFDFDTAAYEAAIWDLTGGNPTSSNITVTLQNLTTGPGGLYTHRRITVAIKRYPTSRINTIGFSGGSLLHVIDGSEAQLMPVISGGTYFDVYEGEIIGTVCFWKRSSSQT